jgi:hypothetical protein
MKKYLVVLGRDGSGVSKRIRKHKNEPAATLEFEGNTYQLDPSRAFSFDHWTIIGNRSVIRTFFAEGQPIAINPFLESFDSELAEVVRRINRDHTLRDILQTTVIPWAYIFAGLGVGVAAGMIISAWMAMSGKAGK